MLREIFDRQDNIKKQVDTKTNILKIKSNDDYYLIKNSNQLQKVLDKTSLDKAFASTQKVNQALLLDKEWQLGRQSNQARQLGKATKQGEKARK